MDIQKVKGTHDVVLSEAEAYEKIEDTMKAIAETFAFRQFRVPVIENSALFQRSVGESSDIVRKEMYTFLDKGDRSITLRPEFTAGIIRSFVNNKLYATKDLPVKAYYVGPVFRYERPQLGRYRQFNQFGIETIGTDNLFHDAEAIILGYQILTCLHLDGVTVKVNTLGDEESRNNYKEALKAYFAKHLDNMCPDCKQRYELNPLRILDCKVPEDQEIVKDAPRMSEYLSDAAKERFDKVLALLEANNVPYEIDDTLVRGLDYYSQTVFEFHYTSSKGKDYGAIGAGGHYSNLVKEIGGPSLEGVGFSFGIERVYSVLADDGEIDEKGEGLDIYLCPQNKDLVQPCFNLCNILRTCGYACEVDIASGKMATMLKRADRANSKYAIIVGDEEYKTQELTVKNLTTQAQCKVDLDDIVYYFDAIFNVEEEHCSCGCEDENDSDECCCGGHHHHQDGECCCHDHDDEACGCHHNEDSCCCEEKEEDHECCCGHHHHCSDEAKGDK